MKRTKNYIEADLAKKKTARYKYWSIKDENGITIVSSDDNPDNRSFDQVLDNIIADNVDAEVQIKYGTNEQSSRNNPPFFIRINETIEWVEPEEETIKVNGVPHRVDKNGNVNISLNTPTPTEHSRTERAVPIDTIRQEMEIQLQGIRREHELKEEKMVMEMHNKIMEQNLKFKEMMLNEREERLREKEQAIANQENQLEEKQKEIQDDVKGYLRQVPKALGGLLKEFVKDGEKNKKSDLGKTAQRTEEKKRKKVRFSIEEDPELDEEEEMTEEELEAEIEREIQREEAEERRREQEEQEAETTNINQHLEEDETDLSVDESDN